jgi:glycosyltransferase involved in cell wall biosynthesis
MHICFATLDYPTGSSGGGVGTVTRILAQGMAHRGHRVSVFRLGRKEDPYQDGEVMVYTIDQGPWHYYVSRLPIIGKLLALPVRELERSFHLSNALRKLHHRHPIDIVEFSEEAGFFLAFSNLRIECTYIARLHGTEHAFLSKIPGRKLTVALKIQRLLQRFFLSRCAHLIAVTEYYKNYLIRDLGIAETKRIKVLWNPLVDEKNIEDIRVKPNSTLIIPCFLYCNRIQDLKGIDLLIRALGFLKKEGIIFNISVVGNYHPSIPVSTLQKLICNENVLEQVHFFGHVEPAQLRTMMLEHTAVVVPSYFETFGMVGLEALQIGAKLIHSKVGIMVDLNLESNTGIELFAPGDLKGLAVAMQKIVNNNENISSTNMREILNQFSVENHIKFFENVMVNNVRCQS